MRVLNDAWSYNAMISINRIYCSDGKVHMHETCFILHSNNHWLHCKLFIHHEKKGSGCILRSSLPRG